MTTLCFLIYKKPAVSLFEQAVYYLNNEELSGTYSFLSTPGKGYLITDGENTFESFTYGYQSNIEKDNWPVRSGVIEILQKDNTKNNQYFAKTENKTVPSLVPSYGVKGSSTLSIIDSSPFLNKLQFNNRGINKISEYSQSKPCVFFDSAVTEEFKGSSGFLDQFHFLIEDKVIRVPLNWRVERSTKAMEITSVKLLDSSAESLNWNFLFPAASSEASMLKIDATEGNKAICSLKPSVLSKSQWKNKTFEYNFKTNFSVTFGNPDYELDLTSTNNRTAPFDVFKDLTIQFIIFTLTSVLYFFLTKPFVTIIFPS